MTAGGGGGRLGREEDRRGGGEAPGGRVKGITSFGESEAGTERNKESGETDEDEVMYVVIMSSSGSNKRKHVQMTQRVAGRRMRVWTHTCDPLLSRHVLLGATQKRGACRRPPRTQSPLPGQRFSNLPPQVVHVKVLAVWGRRRRMEEVGRAVKKGRQITRVEAKCESIRKSRAEGRSGRI